MNRYLVRERGSARALTVWGWHDQAMRSAIDRTLDLDIAHEVVNERTGRVIASFSRDDLLRRAAELRGTPPRP
jgi:hypothetical protein